MAICATQASMADETPEGRSIVILAQRLGMVEALVAQGVRGVVVAATGNGTIHHALQLALRDAAALGVRIVRTTRCAEGQVIGVERPDDEPMTFDYYMPKAIPAGTMVPRTLEAN